MSRIATLIFLLPVLLLANVPKELEKASIDLLVKTAELRLGAQKVILPKPNHWQRNAYRFQVRFDNAAKHFRRLTKLGPHANPRLLRRGFRRLDYNADWASATFEDLFEFPNYPKEYKTLSRTLQDAEKLVAMIGRIVGSL